jgi:hypothetical protein
VKMSDRDSTFILQQPWSEWLNALPGTDQINNGENILR